jgi:transformation/transcription domain-associated protein
MLVSVHTHRMSSECRDLKMSKAPESKKIVASELKEWNDLHREQSEVARYLPVELPIIIQALRDGEPSFKRDSPDQVRLSPQLIAFTAKQAATIVVHQHTRLTLLQIIERLHHSESVKQYAVDIQNLMVHLLRKDNEELGVICVKIVINFNRTYRAILEPHIMPFVEWIVGLYDGMAAVVERTFSDETSGASSSPSTALAGLNSEVSSTTMHSFIHSFNCFGT